MATKHSICFVAPNAYPLISGDPKFTSVGGAELQQTLIAKGLAARGYEVSMICMDHGQKGGLVIDDVRIINAYAPHAGIPGLRFFHPRLTGVWQAMHRADAAVYYQRTAAALTGIVSHFCRRNKRISIYGGAHDDDFLPNSPKLQFTRDKKLLSYGLRHVDKIIVQNNTQLQRVELHYGRKGELIPNAYAPPAKYSHDPDGYLLWVSTLRNWKRPELLLEIARRRPQYRFVMVGGPGNGHEEVFHQCERQAKEINNLEFVGFVPYSQVDKWFDGARILINTSITEGFPNTFLQAWSRSIPAISFVDSGARLPKGDSLELRCNTLDEMVAHIDRLMKNDVQWQHRGNLSHEHYLRHHTIDALLDQFVQIAFEG